MRTTNGDGKGRASRFDIPYDMIVTRRRCLLGFGGLTELRLVGLWTDERGRKRRTDLVRLGAASSVETALRLAVAGMQRYPEGTAAHRRHRDWAARLRATERAMVRAEDRYWRLVRELSGDVPAYSPALAIAAE